MSSTNPPDGPQGPEYLEQGGGAPLARERRPGNRRKAVIAGGALAGVALVGGGVWAAVSFFGAGPQPAEALPASTLGYASIDLDPSGGQKIEAIRMLNKFPAFEDELGLDTDDDIKEKLFEVLELGEACDGLDYADDIEPWLGDRAAFAAIDMGEEQPTVAAVVQVKDAGAADDGLAALRECTGDTDSPGWAVDGEWAVVAETDSIAQDLADEAAQGSLADDEDYQHWTDEVGDAGVFNAYAAPEAGKYLADSLGSLFGFGAMMDGSESLMECTAVEPGADAESCETDMMMPTPEMPAKLREQLEDFGGLAMTLRFDDGALELEAAGDGAMSEGLYGTDRGDDVLATLPDDTAAAFGVGFEEGWFTTLLDQVAAYSGGMSVDQVIAEAEAESGLALPEDAETLAGESAAVAVGPDFDAEAFVNSADGSDIPVGLKVQGDPEAIEAVLAKIQPKITADGGPEVLTETDGDRIAIGLNSEYLSQLAGDGGLGDSDVFQNVVRESEDASAIFFVNFDAGTGWLTEVFGDDPETAENVEPLEGLGMSTWMDGDVAHSVVRLTTN